MRCILFYEVMGALDSGRYDELSVAEVQTAMENGGIVELLHDRLGADVDLSLLTSPCG